VASITHGGEIQGFTWRAMTNECVFEPSFIFYTPDDFFQEELFVGAYHKKLCKSAVITETPHCRVKPTCYNDGVTAASISDAFAQFFIDSQDPNYWRDPTLLVLKVMENALAPFLAVFFKEMTGLGQERVI